ncbi:unnamed protein product [Boreogadus saida]
MHEQTMKLYRDAREWVERGADEKESELHRRVGVVEQNSQETVSRVGRERIRAGKEEEVEEVEEEEEEEVGLTPVLLLDGLTEEASAGCPGVRDLLRDGGLWGRRGDRAPQLQS